MKVAFPDSDEDVDDGVKIIPPTTLIDDDNDDDDMMMMMMETTWIRNPQQD